MQKTLHSSEERFRLIYERSPIGMALVAPDHSFVHTNSALCKMLGYTPEELCQLTFADITHPDDVSTTLTFAEQLFANTIPNYQLEKRYLRKHGEIVYVNLTAALIQDGDENPVYSLALIEDITKRKRAEEEVLVLNQHLQHRTGELEAINRELEAFAYSVSHDLRAPLRSVDGFSLALLEDYKDQLDATAQNYLNRIRVGAQRMGQLIDDILKLSRVTRSEFRLNTIDLSHIATEMMEQMQQQDPTRQAQVEIMDGIVAHADSHLLTIVLQNLLDNAWKFTSTQPITQIIFDTITVGERTVYRVRDNGVGFDMTYIDKLFGAFQRLHGFTEFQGTGIGLATVQRVIHRHGGRVWAEAAVDQGATFYFTLGEKEHDVK